MITLIDVLAIREKYVLENQSEWESIYLNIVDIKDPGLLIALETGFTGMEEHSHSEMKIYHSNDGSYTLISYESASLCEGEHENHSTVYFENEEKLVEFFMDMWGIY